MADFKRPVSVSWGLLIKAPVKLLRGVRGPGTSPSMDLDMLRAAPYRLFERPTANWLYDPKLTLTYKVLIRGLQRRLPVTFAVVLDRALHQRSLLTVESARSVPASREFGEQPGVARARCALGILPFTLPPSKCALARPPC